MKPKVIKNCYTCGNAFCEHNYHQVYDCEGSYERNNDKALDCMSLVCSHWKSKNLTVGELMHEIYKDSVK